jgi:mono/diheme cytochrome c family protein
VKASPSARLGKAVRVRSVSWVIALGVVGLVGLQVTISSQTSSPTAVVTKAQDPGPRKDSTAAGGPLAGLTGQQNEYFVAGKTDFEEVEQPDEGIGPRMNLDSCAGCHSQPATGGSSPAVNPQVAFASKDGGRDSVPSFLAVNGPVREVRFVKNADGSPDGGVHAIFTLTGRQGANGCTLQQPDFAAQAAINNVIFRIPTPTFGAGLIEMIPDAAILANQAAGIATKNSLGIRGRANFAVAGRTVSGQTNNNGNDGTIARFGWKAQNKSLLIFSGEAYNVEMGVTNDLFMTEREEMSKCQFADAPNSITDMDATDPVQAFSSIEKFAAFMRFLAPPTASTTEPGGTTSITSGKGLFQAAGCALCHTPSFTTGTSRILALSNKPVNLFSDLLVHDMGVGLADGVSQGGANGREFRTAPLWGLGQRLYFLHDGRANDLVTAIRAHASTGSEANASVANFFLMSERQKQDLLNFLRSL